MIPVNFLAKLRIHVPLIGRIFDRRNKAFS
jgi:hypothetical protein